MATKFLRKIILEELQKVLKEEFNPSLEVWKSGQAKVSPPVEAGDTTFVGRKPDKKVIKLQKTLKALGLYNCKNCVVDGILGNETKKAIAQMGGTSVQRDPGLRSDKKIMANIDSYIAAASDRLATSAGVARPIEPDVPNTGIDPKMKGSFTPEEEQKIMDYYKTLPGPKESITREISKLLKML